MCVPGLGRSVCGKEDNAIRGFARGEENRVCTSSLAPGLEEEGKQSVMEVNSGAERGCGCVEAETEAEQDAKNQEEGNVSKDGTFGRRVTTMQKAQSQALDRPIGP